MWREFYSEIMSISRVLIIICLLGAYPMPGLTAEVDTIIEGVSGSMLTNIKLYMDIEQQKKSMDHTEANIRQLHAKATEQIKEAVRPFGYYRAAVESSLTLANEIWLARYKVSLGEPIIIQTLQIQLLGEGATDKQLLEETNSFPLQLGDILDHELYKISKQALLRIAYQSGYFDSHFTRHELKVDLEKNKAFIFLFLNTGPRYRFGNVTFVQNIYDDSYLKRFLPFAKGDPFNLDKLAELEFRLNDSDNFQKVDRSNFEHDKTLYQDNEIPIELKLSPKKKHYFQFGLGYSTDTKSRALFKWRNRRLNSKGHQFGSETSISERVEETSLRYAIPLQKPNTDRIEIIGALKKEDSVRAEALTRELILRRTIARSGNWIESLSVRHTSGPFEIEGDRDYDARMFLLGASWSKRVADDLRYPRRGYRFTLDSETTQDDFVGSKTDYFQIRSQIKTIQSSGPNVLVSRAEVGYLATNNFCVLQPDLIFLTGGDHSIRGFDYKSIPSPVQGNKSVFCNDGKPSTNHQTLEVGSIEYQFWFAENWGFSSFYDTGKVEQRTTEAWERGAGIGLLWRSPVGPFSLAVARDLSKRDRAIDERISDKVRIHISIGPNL